MTALPPEGAIRARLRLERGFIADVELKPRPSPPLKALLKGRPILEAVQLLPRLFSLCATAQTVAALNAAEMALGLTPSPALSAARMLFVLAETVQEHATRLLIDGPLLLGLAPDAKAARLIRHHIANVRPLIGADGAWVRPGGGGLSPDSQALAGWLERLRQLVLSHLLAGSDVAGFSQFGELKGWCRQRGSAPAGVLAEILKSGQAALGAGCTPFMGHLDLQRLMATLGADTHQAFVQAPRSDAGYCLETGPLSRQYEHPLVQDIHRHDGYGLAARYAARLIELSHAITGIALSIPLLDSARAQEPPRASGEGIGLAEAARGRLAHWVRLQDGVVEDYRLLAPTEWNFHPEGVYAQGLKGVAAPDPETAIMTARLQGLALDPCVALQIEVA